MSDNEFIAHLQRMSAADRHALILCDLRSHYEAASKGKCPWSFELDFLKLKHYKNLHGWSECFIREKFGYSYNAFKALYYRLQKA